MIAIALRSARLFTLLFERLSLVGMPHPESDVGMSYSSGPGRPGGSRLVRDREPFEEALQSDRVVVIFVPGAKQECDRTALNGGDEKLHLLRSVKQFTEVTPTKFLPSRWIMAEPLAQVIAGGRVLQPGINGAPFSGQSSRPESIDQDTRTIFRTGRLINTLHADSRSCAHDSLPVARSPHGHCGDMKNPRTKKRSRSCGSPNIIAQSPFLKQPCGNHLPPSARPRCGGWLTWHRRADADRHSVPPSVEPRDLTAKVPRDLHTCWSARLLWGCGP